jgi:hypothetical protein
VSHKLLLLLLLIIIPIKGQQRYRYTYISTHHMVNIYIHTWLLDGQNKIE